MPKAAERSVTTCGDRSSQEKASPPLAPSHTRRGNKGQEPSFTWTLSREKRRLQNQGFIPSFKSSFLEDSSIMSSQKAPGGFCRDQGFRAAEGDFWLPAEPIPFLWGTPSPLQGGARGWGWLSLGPQEVLFEEDACHLPTGGGRPGVCRWEGRRAGRGTDNRWPHLMTDGKWKVCPQPRGPCSVVLPRGCFMR